MKNTCRIIFMGTPDFSVPALTSLAEHPDIEIPLVVTQPDRPKGRGKKMAIPPVKQAALKLGLEVYQPENLKDQNAVKTLADLSPDFFVVAAYGQILSQEVLDIPKIYPINIHASLLPKYRGASPIQAAILNMDDQTGITTMVMAKDMDAGDMLLQDATTVQEDDTAQTLHDRLGEMGGTLIIETISQILDKTLQPTPQNHSKATYVKMLKKQDGRINWSSDSRMIQAHVNAMTPWPGAFSLLSGSTVKIFKTRLASRESELAPGTILCSDKTGIYVATGKGTVCILELMGTSGKRLTAQQYLCGHDLAPLTRFDS